MTSVSSAKPVPLIDTLPQPFSSPLLTDALHVVLGAGLVTLLAQLSVPLPFTPVPLTGQTLGVLLCGSMLGARRGAAALALYLLLGAAGFPLFAGAGAGIAHLVGPTAGYLWSFPVAAAAVGMLADRGWDRRPQTAALSLALGSLLILTLGSLWLSVFVGGIVAGVSKGMLPFLPVEAVKIALAFGLPPGLWRFASKERKPHHL